MLVFIDYSAKKDYMIREGAAADTEVSEEDPDFYREEAEISEAEVILMRMR